MDNVMYFARSGGRNYMMRSEKRPGYGNRSPRRRKPKKRRLYKLLTLLLLLLCYPIGLIMLWRKVIRWNGFKKLLISIVTLMLCFVWMSVALLYDFGNPTVKKVQNAVLAQLDKTHEFVQQLGEEWNEIMEKGRENWYSVTDNAAEILAAAGNQAVRGMRDLVATPSPEPTATVEPTQTPEPTKAPRTKYVRPAEGFDRSRIQYLIDMTLTGKSDLTQADLQPTDTPSPQLDSVGTAGGSVTPPPEQPETKGPDGTPIVTTTPTPTPTPTSTPSPSPTPAITMEPMPLTYAFTTSVYYTTTGTYYHKTNVCGTMSQAREHTVADAVHAGKKQCPYCKPVPQTYAAEDAWLVYLSEEGQWHLSDECSAVNGDVEVMLFDELNAREENSVACTVCGANQYALGGPEQLPETPIDPSLLTNGSVLVYYNEQGAYYHGASKCESAVQMSYHAHTLFEAVNDDKEPCPHCNPAKPSFD